MRFWIILRFIIYIALCWRNNSRVMRHGQPVRRVTPLSFIFLVEDVCHLFYRVVKIKWDDLCEIFFFFLLFTYFFGRVVGKITSLLIFEVGFRENRMLLISLRGKDAGRLIFTSFSPSENWFWFSYFHFTGDFSGICLYFLTIMKLS